MIYTEGKMITFFKKLIKRMMCKHENLLAPSISSLSGFSEYKFTVRCKDCGKTKKLKGRKINAGWSVLQAPKNRYRKR